MINKETLYIYTAIGTTCIGIVHKNNTGWSEGWSKKLMDFEATGWSWSQAKEFEGYPIGQRCILQW